MCAHVYLFTCVGSACILVPSCTCVWGFVCMSAYAYRLIHFPSVELLLALADQEGHSEVRTKELTLIAMSKMIHISLQTCMWKLTGTTRVFFEHLSKLIHTASWWFTWRFNSHRWDELIFLVFSTKVVGPCLGWLRITSLHQPFLPAGEAQQLRHQVWSTPEPRTKGQAPTHPCIQHRCEQTSFPLLEPAWMPTYGSASLGLHTNAVTAQLWWTVGSKA